MYKTILPLSLSCVSYCGEYQPENQNLNVYFSSNLPYCSSPKTWHHVGLFYSEIKDLFLNYIICYTNTNNEGEYSDIKDQKRLKDWYLSN